MATKNKDRGRDRRDRPSDEPRANRPDEDATIGDAQREIARGREDTRRRKEDGTARHGKPPPVRGLEGDDEPHGEDIAKGDHREGVISGHTFRHVEKRAQRKPKREEDG